MSLLRPARRLREGRDFPSGSKLNMRRVMAWEADPRLYDKLGRAASDAPAIQRGGE
jgi:hypothetical protein